MRKFGLGLLLGLIAGAVVPAAATQVVGGSGYLMGWTVSLDGDEVCDDPYVYPGSKEIECD